MSKIYSALAGLCLSVLALGAQPAVAQVTPQHYVRCATQEANDYQQRQLMKLNPGYDPTPQTTPSRAAAMRTTVTYTLPVVVHVINNGEAVGVGTNVSQAQVQSQIDVLNEDYRKLNPDGATVVPSVYQPARGNAQIQFVSARIDPSGNVMAEPGIDRVNRNTKGWTAGPYTQTYIDGTIKPGSDWDPSKYVNIWIMNLGGGLLGYAQFPNNTAGLQGLSTSGGAANTDGVVILYSAFGSRAKAPSGTYVTAYDKGRTLTHELGHWLGLRHIWGDANCGNDYCNDTPTQQTSNFGCPAFPHVTCSNVTGDQSMNYMDYVDDACMAMFSNDQVSRIQAIMAAGTPHRSELVNSTVACPNAVAVTAGNSGPGCVGGTLNLTATSVTGATYSWTGPNGYTSTQQNPTLTNLTAAMAGTYTVVASVTTGACPGTSATTVVINTPPPTPTLATTATNVCPGSSATLSAPNLVPSALISENFNGAATGWTLGNTGLATTAWQYRTPPYSYSSAYLTLNNYSIDGTRFVLANSDVGGQGSTTNTTLTSPAFSSMGYSALQVTFQHYFVFGTGDAATVEASTDGGATWATVTSYTSTQGSATAPATATVNLGAYLNKTSLQLRWHYVASWGYAWALDNVNVTGTAAVVNYAWSVVSGNGLPTATNTPSITVTPTQPSVYRLTVNYAGSSCTSSATVAVSTLPVPALASASPTVTLGNTTTLSATNLTGISGLTYSWSLVSGDGLPAVTNTPTITVTPTRASVYKLTISSSGGCTTSAIISVGLVVDKATASAFPVPFTSNGVSLQVATNTPGALHVLIYDVMGRKVYDQDVANAEVGLNTVALPNSGVLLPGKYIIIVQQGGQEFHLNVLRDSN